MNLPPKVRNLEVGPRDGLQNEPLGESGPGPTGLALAAKGAHQA